MKSIDLVRDFIKYEQIDYLLVNSTNKFLVEYNTLDANSRYKLTGFSGSTGDALVSSDKCFLFVDGRYHIQADLEVDHSITDVVKLQTGETFLEKIVEKIPDNSLLGVCAEKNSMQRIDSLRKALNAKNVRVRILDTDPLDENYTTTHRKIDSVPLEFAGKSPSQKRQYISGMLGQNQAFLITNLEEVSYLCNLRCFSEQYASQIYGKLLLLKDNAVLFTDENLCGFDDFVIKKYSDFDNYISGFEGKVLVDKSSINAHDYFVLGDKAEFVNENPVKLLKSIKTDAEINHYKTAFEATDKTLHAIRDYINNNNKISEFDIAEQLEKEFYRFGAKNLSFRPIVAKDKNAALAHYSKSAKDEVLKDGSLVLIDCGAYYEGGIATDITRVFVKGEPSKLQKKVYTTVLKMFLNAYNYSADNFCGYDVDSLARKIYDTNPIDGFVFNHGLGHGIGVSVHEAPPNLSKNEIAKTPIKENMCFTIEPGLYNPEHFGVRLENSCYLKDGKIKSFVKMNYENKLIDYTLLSEQEKEWLKEFEVL